VVGEVERESGNPEVWEEVKGEVETKFGVSEVEQESGDQEEAEIV